MKTLYTTNARSLREAADRCITYLDTLYYEEESKMDGLWEKANQVSEIAYKIYNLSTVAGMLGEALEDDMNSGVAWVLYEDLRRYSDDLEGLVSDIMALQIIEADKPEKGKKK
jgi:hypothetical protein